MTDRILIELTGDLPDENKYAVLAAAMTAADKMATELKETHRIELAVTVKPIRPSTRKEKVVVPTAVAAVPPADTEVTTQQHRSRHAAE